MRGRIESSGVPPSAERPAPHGAGTGIAALLAALMLLSAGAAWAADGRPREGEGAAPGPGGAAAAPTWSVVRTPELPGGTTFGELWTSERGDLYVWALVPVATRTFPALDDAPGETLPPGRLNLPTYASRLYRLDAAGWALVLSVAGESPGAVFGTGPDDVYATTTSRQGAVSVWHGGLGTWAREPLPVALTGGAHNFAGAPGDVWLRVGATILRRDVGGWSASHTLPPGAGGSGLAYVGEGRVIAPSSCGHCLFDGTTWTAVPEDFTFSGITDAWGFRAPCGTLCVYAVGCNEQENGVRVWRFTEDSPGSLTGCWGGRTGTVVSDPPGAGVPWIGSAEHVWGAARNDVYVAGTLEGRGVVHHFDGTAWNRLGPGEELPGIRGVSGTGHGTVWFALADGRLLRYQRPNATPDVDRASLSIESLWPPSSEWMPVKVLGVTDFDGDFVTLRMVQVTQDEPVTETLACPATCPDALVVGTVVWLRAERDNNGNGRVYEITFQADDGFGGVTTGRVRAGAPIEPGWTSVDDGQRYDSSGPCVWPAPRALRVTHDPSGGVRIALRLAAAVEGRVLVHDVAGRVVARLAAGRFEPGVRELVWSGDGCRAGVYFVRLHAAGVTQSCTVLLR